MKNLKQKLLVALSFVAVAVLMTACASSTPKVKIALDDFKIESDEIVFDKLDYESNLDKAKSTLEIGLEEYEYQNEGSGETVYTSTSKLEFNGRDADTMITIKDGKVKAIAFSSMVFKGESWLEDVPKTLIENFGKATKAIGDYQSGTYPAGLQWTVGDTVLNYQLMTSGDAIMCTIGILKK